MTTTATTQFFNDYITANPYKGGSRKAWNLRYQAALASYLHGSLTTMNYVVERASAMDAATYAAALARRQEILDELATIEAA